MRKIVEKAQDYRMCACSVRLIEPCGIIVPPVLSGGSRLFVKGGGGGGVELVCMSILYFLAPKKYIVRANLHAIAY